MLAALTVLWMDWGTRDEEVRKAHGILIRELIVAATPNTPEEVGGTEDNPFPGVLRTGSAGVISST